jgi:hypothetical protein
MLLSATLSIGLPVASEGSAITADCTNPAVNDHFRTQMVNATVDGQPLRGDVRLALVGSMEPVAQDGANLTCKAWVRVTVRGEGSAVRSTTVYLTVRDGVIEKLDFVMAPKP